ncbi:hypothetical protein N0V91_005558 [Didymella pomorum]|uniref:Uncharacterized protein n=1 Tax=Didymella pomorum TaxID=749634 RepID=A0A9W8ZCR3_9PLEO|nr:hypothetical protein N0V91_005558 [Didymella pomorum]
MASDRRRSLINPIQSATANNVALQRNLGRTTEAGLQPIGWDKESPKKGWQNGRVLIIDSFEGAPNPTANEFKNLETLQIFRTDEQPNRKKVQLTSNNGQPTSNDSQTTSNNGKTTSDNE